MGEHPGRSSWRIVAITVAFSLVLAVPACSSSSDRAAETEGATGHIEQTPWERELANVSSDGTRSLESALRLFAIAFGPLPGVDAPTGPHEFVDATIAVAEVRARESELTPEQREAVEAALRPPPDSVAFTISPEGEITTGSPPGGSGSRTRRPTAPPNPKSIGELAPIFLLARQEITAKLGWNYPGYLAFQTGRAGGNYAWTDGLWNDAGFLGCIITFDPRENRTLKESRNTLFHETAHCFQQSTQANSALADDAHRTAEWAWEGSAEWIGTTLAGPDRATPGRWRNYLTQPSKALFKRAYDALGFFAHLEESGTDPWSVFGAMWVASVAGAQAAYDASGAGEQFLDSWASGYFRGAVAGQDWDTRGPGITKHKPKPVAVSIGRDDPEGQPFEARAFTNSVYRLRAAADVVEVTVEPGGHVRVSDGSTDTVVSGVGQFCTKPGGCTCPSGGDSGAAPPLLQRTSALAISGGTGGAKATITGFSVKELCCAEPSRASSAGGLTFKPRVDCQKIGLKIEKAGSLKLNIGFALLVDGPRLRPHFTTKNGKQVLEGVDLEGINGILLDFGAGAAHGNADNEEFQVKVPLEIDVPVRPRVRGMPASLKVGWEVLIDTAIVGNNSTLLAGGTYDLAGPFGVRNGAVAAPTLSIRDSLIDSINGITLGPSGIVIAVKTTFSGGSGTPSAMKGSFAAFTASFGVTNGSTLAFPYVVCRGVSLSLIFAAGGGSLARAKKTFVNQGQVVPDVNICRGG